MERSASPPARIVEVRAGPEARALRPGVGSARAAQSRQPSSRREPRRFERTLAKILDQERRIGTTATARTAAGRSARTARRPRLRQRHPTTTATSGADPKDKILEFRRANQAHAGRASGVEPARLRVRGARVRGIDWQRHRELRGSPVSRPIVGGHEARRSRRAAFRAGGAAGAAARRGVDGLGRSASRDRWSRARAGDRPRGPETESAERGGSRCSTADLCLRLRTTRRSRGRLQGRSPAAARRMRRSASSSVSSSAISGRSTRRSPASVTRSPSTRPMRRPGTRSA